MFYSQLDVELHLTLYINASLAYTIVIRIWTEYEEEWNLLLVLLKTTCYHSQASSPFNSFSICVKYIKLLSLTNFKLFNYINDKKKLFL